MDWDQAQANIRAHVCVGTDLNRSAKYRFVEAVDAIIDSGRCGYRSERGFVVSICQDQDSLEYA